MGRCEGRHTHPDAKRTEVPRAPIWAQALQMLLESVRIMLTEERG
jgi:hypothetical protein